MSLLGSIAFKKLGSIVIPSRIANKNNPVMFKLYLYVFDSGHKYYVLERGNCKAKTNILLRIDSKCIYAHIFGSARCDCGEQLHEAIKKIGAEKEGLLIFGYDQDGRGISLEDHMVVYGLQDEGYDTVDANLKAGLKPDQRDYSEISNIIKDFELTSIRLLSNNPHRIQSIIDSGIKVTRVPFKVVDLDKYNAAQLIVKQTKLGHLFGWDLNDAKVKELFNKSLAQEDWE